MCPFVYNCTPLGYSLFNHGTDSVECFQSDGSIYDKTRVDLIKNRQCMKLDQTEQVSLWIPKQKKRQNKTQNPHSRLFMKEIKKQFQLLSKCVIRFPEKTGFTFVNQRRRMIFFYLSM